MTSDLRKGKKERDWNCSVPSSFRFYSWGEVGTGVAPERVSWEGWLVWVFVLGGRMSIISVGWSFCAYMGTGYPITIRGLQGQEFWFEVKAVWTDHLGPWSLWEMPVLPWVTWECWHHRREAGAPEMDRATEEDGSKSVTAWLPFAYSLGYCSLQCVSEKSSACPRWLGWMEPSPQI